VAPPLGPALDWWLMLDQVTRQRAYTLAQHRGGRGRATQRRKARKVLCTPPIKMGRCQPPRSHSKRRRRPALPASGRQPTCATSRSETAVRLLTLRGRGGGAAAERAPDNHQECGGQQAAEAKHSAPPRMGSRNALTRAQRRSPPSQGLGSVRRRQRDVTANDQHGAQTGGGVALLSHAVGGPSTPFKECKAEHNAATRTVIRASHACRPPLTRREAWVWAGGECPKVGRQGMSVAG
jgi:hypothetical protein